MSTKIIKHEIKLQKSVIIILGVFAVGIFLNAFGENLKIKDAFASSRTLVGVCHIHTTKCADVEGSSSGDALLVKVVN